MELKVFTVDAFTSVPFGGNPAAVVPLEKPLPEELLQKIATEFNLSETAYVTPLTTSDSSAASNWSTTSRFGLRWFTPTNEVPLCGHATLASAHVLFACLGNTSSKLQFETLSGTLVAKRNATTQHIILDFPNNEPVALDDQQTSLQNLVELVKEKLPVQDVKVSFSAKKLLVRVNDSCTREQLEAFRVEDAKLLSCHDGTLIKGLILTLRGDRTGKKSGRANLADYDFVSRYFAAWNGISEDPVTGSAHTVLGPYWTKELGVSELRCEYWAKELGVSELRCEYWAKELGESDLRCEYWAKELGVSELRCRQCSARGGDLIVTVRADGRVDIEGAAVKVLQGTFSL
ncbi:Phenazine biosynthesis PhzF protein [Trinorchestia longiramus]|nr:Phenazine biosynthesis PhzF protein [Trinorchestia longiramus]